MKKNNTRIICLFLFLLGWGLCFSSNRNYGMSWDEGIYLSAVVRHGQWFKEWKSQWMKGNLRAPFRRESLDRYWYFNHETPPLVQYIYGMAHAVTLGMFGYRIPARVVAWAFFGGLGVLVFMLARMFLSKAQSIVSALVFIFLPRVLGHAHFAALDIPGIFFAYLWVYLFLRTRWKKRSSVYVLLLFFGLAISARISTIATIGPLLLWSLFYPKPEGYFRKLFFVLSGGMLVFVMVWPWMWPAPASRLVSFFLYYWDHVQIPTYYLGHFYGGVQKTPWHYTLVYFLFTTPVVVLFMAFMATAANVFFPRKEKLCFLHVLLVLLPILFQSRPDTARYDAVRLILMVYPSLAILAVVGIKMLSWWGARIFLTWNFHPFGHRHSGEKLWLTRILTGLVLGMVIFQGIPFFRGGGLSYFNEIIGGISGAKRRGLEYTYWFEPFNSNVLRYLEKNANNEEIIVSPKIAENVFYMYRRDRDIPGEMRIRSADTPPEGFKGWWLIYNRQGALGTDAVYYRLNHSSQRVFSLRGVPLIEVYHVL